MLDQINLHIHLIINQIYISPPEKNLTVNQR
jgi:hypothetical protein